MSGMKKRKIPLLICILWATEFENGKILYFSQPFSSTGFLFKPLFSRIFGGLQKRHVTVIWIPQRQVSDAYERIQSVQWPCHKRPLPTSDSSPL